MRRDRTGEAARGGIDGPGPLRTGASAVAAGMDLQCSATMRARRAAGGLGRIEEQGGGRHTARVTACSRQERRAEGRRRNMEDVAHPWRRCVAGAVPRAACTWACEAAARRHGGFIFNFYF